MGELIIYLTIISVVSIFLISFFAYKLEKKRWLLFVLFPLFVLTGFWAVNFLFSLISLPHHTGPDASLFGGLDALSLIPILGLFIGCLICVFRFENISKSWLLIALVETLILLVFIYFLASRPITILVEDENKFPVVDANVEWEVRPEISLLFNLNRKGN